MAGHRNYNELRKRISPARRARNDRAIQQELKRMVLSELRRTAGMTQVRLAQTLGIKQPSLSYLESQDDMQISTLRRIVEALNGELEIIVKLPGGNVSLSQFKEPGRRRKSA